METGVRVEAEHKPFRKLMMKNDLDHLRKFQPPEVSTAESLFFDRPL